MFGIWIIFSGSVWVVLGLLLIGSGLFLSETDVSALGLILLVGSVGDWVLLVGSAWVLLVVRLFFFFGSGGFVEI